MKERWFNYRPIFLVFCFLLLGSVFAFYITKNIPLVLICAVAVLALLITVAILKRKSKYVLVPLMAFVLGCLAYYLAIYNFNKTKVDYIPSNIQVRICDISNEENGTMLVEADNCVFDGVKDKHKLRLYVRDVTGLYTNIEVGNIIQFEPYNFYKTDLFYYSTPSASLYSNDLAYTASVYAHDIKYLSTDKTLTEKFQDKVKDNLYEGLTNENAEIAYSAMFGDKDALSSQQYDAYKLSGVAHLLAVSGLHVGIIVGILNFIFDKLKANKWVKFTFIAAFLSVYAYLCGFTISIVRASIMSLMVLFARNSGRPYDSLNSIGLAGIIVFLINPLCIFDVGFLLSFSCVLGITLFYNTFNKIFLKTKLSEKLSASISISLATSLSILIIMACFFKTLNIISLIANILIIPIFTIGFVFIFIISIISLIMPQLSILMFPANYILDFININATILGNLPISNFETIDIAFVAIVVYFVLLLFLSRFCTANRKHKVIASLPIFAVLLICLLI